MAGVALAHELAVRRGVTRIVLVDSRDPLSLTSSKGTEAYRNYWPAPDDTMVRFMNRSIDLLDSLDRETNGAFALNRYGYVFLTADPAEPTGCATTPVRPRRSSRVLKRFTPGSRSSPIARARCCTSAAPDT